MSRTKVDARVQGVYFMLGCAGLLPWNALITATPYFLDRLAGSSLQPTFVSYMSCIFTGVMVIALAYATLTSKQATVSPSRRIVSSTVVLAVLIALLFMTTFVRFPPSIFFSLVLLIAVGQAVGASYLSAAISGEASLFGGPYMSALISGQAAVAVAVSALQLVSSALSVWRNPSKSDQASITLENEALDTAAESAARVFFGISALFLIATVISYWRMRQLPLYKSTVAPQQQHRRGTSEEDEELQRLVASEHSLKPSYGLEEMKRVFKANLPYEFASLYGFSITLAVFPAITVQIQSTNPSTHPLLFVATHFLVFNIGDLLGRYSCSIPQLVIWSARRILTISLLRTLFIPVFLACNVQGLSSGSATGPLISSDLVYMIILLFLGISNGYISSSSMIGCASLEHNPRLKGRREDVDVAATLNNFSIITGLAVGSAASFAVRAMLCDCNPFKG
ncbi:hypothetical protein CONPUDRAFT_54014 [Coniophora puteana RWD-64-598 SS2]|uniref:Nucleoside transporter n=1 Tax=Coniophora puteana (strain RWD-64-598) TaxID=741705 RepID=A0A5M3MUW6_CONPW|nr:uncharacterized protein CONPUDRAFT_54014 [Coniophora puteana RWD-64-598 SS2]EIW82515.1 hypothetical protein CONPUDRAFT_54014 [Coniophora puteana RWD-64-598 SS2]